MEEQASPVRRRSTTRAAVAGMALSLVLLAAGCGRGDDATADRPERSTTTSVVATTASTEPPAPSSTATVTVAPTTAPPSTLAPSASAALDQELASIGSSLDAADAANRQADPGLARQQEGTAP